MPHQLIKINASKPLDWEALEKIHGLTGFPYKKPLDFADKDDDFAKTVQASHRTYIVEDEVWKFRIGKGSDRFIRIATPYEEASYLQQLESIPNICRFKRYVEYPDHTVLVLEFFNNIGTLADTEIPHRFKEKVERQKHAVIRAVNAAGILHNDMADFNFLVGPDYDLCLIDFDNAEPANDRTDYEHAQYYRVPQPPPDLFIGEDETPPIFQVICPTCSLELEIPKRGKWRCPGCESEFRC